MLAFDAFRISDSLKLLLSFYFFSFSPSKTKTRYTTAQAWYPSLPSRTTTTPFFSAHLHQTITYTPDRFKCFPQASSNTRPIYRFLLRLSHYTVPMHFSGLIFCSRIMMVVDVLCPLLLLWKQCFSTLMEHCVTQILSICMLFAKCFVRLLNSDPSDFNGGTPITEEFFIENISGRHNEDLCHILLSDWEIQRSRKFMEDKEAMFQR